MSRGDARTKTRRIGIIGAGPGGICMAIKLREAGIDTFTIFERAPASAARGTTTATRAARATCRRRSTRSRSSSSATGRARTARSPRSSPTSSTARRSTGSLPHLRLDNGVAARSGGTTSARCGTSPPSAARSSRPTSSSARSACSATRAGPTSRGSTRSRAPCSTRRAGTTTTTSPASASAVIGSAASAVQFVPEIAPAVGAARRVPAHAELGAAEGRHPVHAGAARAVPHRPRRAAAALRGRSATASTAASRSRPGGVAPSRGSGPRRTSTSSRTPSVRAKLTPDLPVRLQAAAGLERLLPDVQPPQRRARHRPDRAHRRRRGVVTADGGSATGRHAHPRHRLRDHAVPLRRST